MAEAYEEITAAGQRLECQWLGPRPSEDPDGPPTLVFLHEGLGCVALWRDFPMKLVEATGLGGFVYSRQGYGGSEPCQLPEIDHYWSRPELDDLDRLFNQECDSQHGGPVEFEIEKKGDAPEVFELLWGDVTDYERDVEADASEDETGGA